MKVATLALLGGKAVISRTPKVYNPIGKEEVRAASKVLRSGNLSGFYGSWDPRFFGGPEVQAFEKEWAKHFRVDNAVSVNSNTSGLIAAVGAVATEPGDEIIVSPWTMSATATAILVWNAIPVFTDIEDRTFNLDPHLVEARINERTRAILVTDIFGHPARLQELKDIAQRHNLFLIEDAAQSPGALYKDQQVGTIGDIGVYSLNCHKHIHTGEGGVCVTNNPKLAMRMQLIRNHAESVVCDNGESDFTNMIGFNFRLTEVQAAIGREQLRKLDGILARRTAIAQRLNGFLKGLLGIRTPVIEEDCTHSFYVYPILYDKNLTGLSRRTLAAALREEGVAVSEGYCNLHLLPMYQQKIAYGRKGYPWKTQSGNSSVNYNKGICPIAESMHDEQFIGFGISRYAYSDLDVERIGKAFEKVWRNLEPLREYDSNLRLG